MSISHSSVIWAIYHYHTSEIKMFSLLGLYCWAPLLQCQRLVPPSYWSTQKTRVFITSDIVLFLLSGAYAVCKSTPCPPYPQCVFLLCDLQILIPKPALGCHGDPKAVLVPIYWDVTLHAVCLSDRFLPLIFINGFWTTIYFVTSNIIAAITQVIGWKAKKHQYRLQHYYCYHLRLFSTTIILSLLLLLGNIIINISYYYPCNQCDVLHIHVLYTQHIHKRNIFESKVPVY